MKLNEYLRMMAGIFVVISVLLARFHSQWWLLFTLFVGLNLLQSAFTKWCPGMIILRKLGIQE
jgi:hypothetical protein